MGPSKEAVSRVSRRIIMSTSGEVAGRGINLFLPFALFSVHSVGSDTDVFFLVMAVSFFVQGTLANALVNAMVPEFVCNVEEKNIRGFLVWAIIPSLLAAFVSGFLVYGVNSAYIVILSSASVMLMAFSSLAAAPSVAALQADHRYGLSGFTWGFRIIPVVLYLLFFPATPALHWLLAGLALSDFTRMLVLAYFTRSQFFISRKFKSLHIPLSSRHLVVALIIAGFTPLIARWIASMGDDGDVSIFEAADRLYAAIATLSTIGVGNVTLVYLARLTKTLEEGSSWKLIFRISLVWSLLWMIPCVLLWFVFPYVTIWMEFQTTDVLDEVRQTFLTLFLGLPAFIMTNVLSRRLLTLGYSSTLVPMSAVALVFNSLVGGVLFSYIGPMGIGVALSASQYIIVVLMSYKLKKVGLIHG